MQIGFKTDRGNKRLNNEDSFFVMPKEGIFIVADGVGGHNSGELASRTAVTAIAEFIKANNIKEISNEEDIRGYFLDCLREANLRVYEMAKSNEENHGMATTVVLAYIHTDYCYMINVGDSRGYIVRNGEIKQITEDHTYVNELLKNGTIDEEIASAHPQRNMITRALGGEKSLSPDLYKIQIEKGDVICLCSDGLYNEIPIDFLCETISSASNMNSLVKTLTNHANNNGGNDNITVICIRI